MLPEQGTLDPDLLVWMEAQHFALITRNRKSMPGHLQRHLMAGGHVPGIFILRPSAAMSEVVEDLLLIWRLADVDEYLDQIIHIPFSPTGD